METRSRLSRFFGGLFIAAWVLLLVGATAVRFEWLPVGSGLLVVSLSAFVLLLYGVFYLPGIFLRMVTRKPVAPKPLSRCLLGLLPTATFFFMVGPEGLQAPAIHDISTDLSNPPTLELAGQDRNASDHSIDYEGEVIANLQRTAYGDFESMASEKPPAEVIAAARRTAEEMDWRILGVREAPGGGITLEAVDSSFLFRYEDDIAVRALPSGDGSLIDVRSASRVGLGDLGANAKRIREFLSELRKKI
jgi:hypothetical protein